MLKNWVMKCKEAEIPVSDDFTLMRILTEEVQIREW
jgi:dynein heavy chain